MGERDKPCCQGYRVANNLIWIMTWWVFCFNVTSDSGIVTSDSD